MKQLLPPLFLLLFFPSFLSAQAGALDPTFGVGGIIIGQSSVQSGSTSWAADVTEDGKILIGGNAHSPYLMRYLPDGARDASFADNGLLLCPDLSAQKMKALPGGKILLVGQQITRLNADGSTDPSCNGALPQGAHIASDCILQPGGKFILALSGTNAPFNQYCVARYLENGALDLAFGQNGFAFAGSEWSGITGDLAAQPDGKILVTGYNGHEKLSMARYLPDGTPDLDFGNNGVVVWGDTIVAPPDWYLAWGGDTIREYPFATKMMVQPDGKILVATQAVIFDTLNYYDWVTQVGLFRLNSDGTVDSTFGVNGMAVLSEVKSVYDIFLQAGGIIQVAIAREYSEALIQLLPNGDIDPNFVEHLFTSNQFDNSSQRPDFAQQPDGKIIAAVSVRWYEQPMAVLPFRMMATRLLTDGATDFGFGGINSESGWITDTPAYSDDYASGMIIRPDGKILRLGRYSQFIFQYNHYVWRSFPSLSRYNADGTIDPGGTISGSSIFPFYYQSFSDMYFYGVASLPDNKTILAYSFNGFKIARFKTNATLDSTFGINGSANLNNFQSYAGLVAQPDGKVLVAGAVLSGATMVLRFLTTGDLDPSFGSNGAAHLGDIGSCKGIVLLNNGKIALAGDGGKVAQLTSAGQLDPAFNNGGIAQYPLPINALAAQSDGKIVLGSAVTQISIARLSIDGSGLDASFGGGAGIVSFSTSGLANCKSVAVQPDGKIVATGANNSLILARCTATGAVDSTFGSNGITETDFGFQQNEPTTVAIHPNGKIVVAATIRQITGTRVGLIRYLSGLTVGANNPVQPQTAIMALPNPFSSALFLDFSALPAEVSSVDVFDMSGRQVFQANDFVAQKMDVPESKNWMPGVYLLRVRTESGVFLQKIVKQ